VGERRGKREHRRRWIKNAMGEGGAEGVSEQRTWCVSTSESALWERVHKLAVDVRACVDGKAGTEVEVDGSAGVSDVVDALRTLNVPNVTAAGRGMENRRGARLDVVVVVRAGKKEVATFSGSVEVVPARRVVNDAVDANWPPFWIDGYEGWLIRELAAEKAPTWLTAFCKESEVERYFKAAEGMQPQLRDLRGSNSRMTEEELREVEDYGPKIANEVRAVKTAALGLTVSGKADTERRAVLVRGIEMAISMYDTFTRLSREELRRRTDK
jgi:hypothetical protein